MLDAVIDDLARLPDSEILTTWDRRLGPVPFHRKNVRTATVPTPEQESAVFSELLNEADYGLVIAPETDHVLSRRCRRIAESDTVSLNASPVAIDLCGDKLVLAERFRQHGIPTLPTLPADAAPAWTESFPSVLKLRHGAGSERMCLLASFAHWEQVCADVDVSQFICQPFVRGRSVSVAGVFEHGRLRHLFPIAEQRLSADGVFRYLGGAIPAELETEQEQVIHRSVEQAGAMVVKCGREDAKGDDEREEKRNGGGTRGETREAGGTIGLRIGETFGEPASEPVHHGLHGYIGFDFLIPERTPNGIAQQKMSPIPSSSGLFPPLSSRPRFSPGIVPGTPLLVEINPRLTTSYVGYRRLCRENLGACLLPGIGSAPTMTGSVQFLADGTIFSKTS